MHTSSLLSAAINFVSYSSSMLTKFKRFIGDKRNYCCVYQTSKYPYKINLKMWIASQFGNLSRRRSSWLLENPEANQMRRCCYPLLYFFARVSKIHGRKAENQNHATEKKPYFQWETFATLRQVVERRIVDHQVKWQQTIPNTHGKGWPAGEEYIVHHHRPVVHYCCVRKKRVEFIKKLQISMFTFTVAYIITWGWNFLQIGFWEGLALWKIRWNSCGAYDRATLINVYSCCYEYATSPTVSIISMQPLQLLVWIMIVGKALKRRETELIKRTYHTESVDNIFIKKI